MHKKVKLISHDCLPILMLFYIMIHIMLAYLMLLAALSNVVVCIILFLLIFASAFCFMLCLGLLTHRLFIPSMIIRHAQWF